MTTGPIDHIHIVSRVALQVPPLLSRCQPSNTSYFTFYYLLYYSHSSEFTLFFNLLCIKQFLLIFIISLVAGTERPEYLPVWKPMMSKNGSTLNPWFILGQHAHSLNSSWAYLTPQVTSYRGNIIPSHGLQIAYVFMMIYPQLASCRMNETNGPVY